MDKIRVGLIGFGLSGKYFHAALLRDHPGYEVRLVCTSRVEDVRAFLPRAEVVATAEKLIASPQIDLVINCAPNRYHFEYAAQALDNGKHVVVEKPFANRVAEAKTLIAKAATADRVLSVYHNRRWDADFLTIKNLLGERRLGEIKQFESHMDRWRPAVRASRWREQAGEGSGTFFDLGPHLIDQVLALFGRPEKIFSDVICQKNGGHTDDYFHLIFYYRNMRAILHSTSFATSTPRFQVFGDRASYIKFGMDPQEEQLKAGVNPLAAEYGQDANPGILKFEAQSEELSSLKGRYLEYYDLLHSAIRDGAANPVPPSEALQTMEILELVARGGLFELS